MAFRKTSIQQDSPNLFSEEMLSETQLLPDLSEDSLQVSDREDAFIFMSFGSGSSGNCSYVGDAEGGFLVDAGVDLVNVEKGLVDKGLSMNKVRGVILTHDHGDHVRYIYTFLRNYRHLLVYCTPKMLNGILRRHSISRRIKDYHRAIYKEFEFNIGNFTITPFEVSHDGTDNCGFFIVHGTSTMAIATDMGCITERAEYYMSRVNFLMIESNYDHTMLVEGAYHDHLKARIIADTGHLDNKVSAEFVTRIWRPELSHVFLCHLSHDNNRPEIAYLTYKKTLTERFPSIKIGDGRQEHLSDLQLVVLPRYDVTPVYYLKAKEVGSKA